MPAAVETSIWLALKARVATLVTDPVMKHDLPKSEFTKPKTGNNIDPYLEVRHLTNTNQRRMIGSTDAHERPGVLQISVMYPISLTIGTQDWEAVIGEIAGTVAAHFPTDLKMTFEGVTVSVDAAPSVSQGFRDEAYWRVPVSIRWTCFK